MARTLITMHRSRESRNPFKRFQTGFERLLREYARAIKRCCHSLGASEPSSLAFSLACCRFLWPFLGENFFPEVDSGQILMHVRAQPGTRIEETARLFDQVEQTVRKTIPPDQLDNIVDNIGLPFSGINMAYQNTGTIGPEDGDALISLKEDHAPTASYIKQLRTLLPQQFPGTTFSFLPADIVSQILNFGLPAPIDVQVIGNNQKANYAYATGLLKRIRQVPGIADLRIQQVFNYPQINVDVDRTLAQEVGLTQRDAANSLLVTLSGSARFNRTSGSTPRTASPIRSSRKCRSTGSIPSRTSSTCRSPRRTRRVPNISAGLPASRPGPSAGSCRTTTSSR
jgi:multidrug efflux pump subunit AcrB